MSLSSINGVSPAFRQAPQRVNELPTEQTTQVQSLKDEPKDEVAFRGNCPDCECEVKATTGKKVANGALVATAAVGTAGVVGNFIKADPEMKAAVIDGLKQGAEYLPDGLKAIGKSCFNGLKKLANHPKIALATMLAAGLAGFALRVYGTIDSVKSADKCVTVEPKKVV